MPEFPPVASLSDLAGLDHEDIVFGFVAGAGGEPEPVASVFSRAYVHGWRVGRVNAGLDEPDAFIRLLDYAFQNQSTWLH